MKSSLSTKLSFSLCALVGGVFISTASAKPFKLFSHDHDRDREREPEQKVYIITDDTAQPGTGIVRVVPTPEGTPGSTGVVRVVPTPQPGSRKPKKGETHYLERVEPAEVTRDSSGETIVIRKAEAVNEDNERIATTEEKHAPVKTSRHSSTKESTQTTRRMAQSPERDEETEVKTRVAASRHEDHDATPTRKSEEDAEVKTRVTTSKQEARDVPATHKHDEEEEITPRVSTTTEKERIGAPELPKHKAVEESTSTSVVRSNNPLMPNPAATEERKPLVPAQIPVPRQETTVTKEVTTSRAPSVEESPPEQRVQQVEESATSTPTPEVPKLTAPSDYAGASNSPRSPANLPPGTIEKTGSKRSSDIPVAEKTEKPGFVKTPFTPSKLIDVRGMASGSLAKDPSTGQVFRVP